MDKPKKKDSVEYILYPHEEGDNPDTGTGNSRRKVSELPVEKQS